MHPIVKSLFLVGRCVAAAGAALVFASLARRQAFEAGSELLTVVTNTLATETPSSLGAQA